jgi:hypothetical protein
MNDWQQQQAADLIEPLKPTATYRLLNLYKNPSSSPRRFKQPTFNNPSLVSSL